MGKKCGHFKKWNASVQESLISLLKGGIQKGPKTTQKKKPRVSSKDILIGGVDQNWILIVKFQKVRYN
jgi:hypothetical protein